MRESAGLERAQRTNEKVGQQTYRADLPWQWSVKISTNCGLSRRLTTELASQTDTVYKNKHGDEFEASRTRPYTVRHRSLCYCIGYARHTHASMDRGIWESILQNNCCKSHYQVDKILAAGPVPRSDGCSGRLKNMNRGG